MLHTGIYKSAHLACIRSACRAIVALCQEYGPRATRTLTRILRLESVPRIQGVKGAAVVTTASPSQRRSRGAIANPLWFEK